MYEYKGPIKFWYDLFPSIAVILICCGMMCFPLLFLSCKDKTEAKELVHEQEVEFVPYSTAPASEGAIWLESEEIPPPSISYWDGDKELKYYPEPNESKSKGCENCEGCLRCVIIDWPDTNPNNIVFDLTKPNELDDGITITTIPYTHIEPNEPEYKIMSISISERINAIIPTWPDYIELEKDLVIDIPVDFGDIKTFGYKLIKGTKIYFKE